LGSHRTAALRDVARLAAWVVATDAVIPVGRQEAMGAAIFAKTQQVIMGVARLAATRAAMDVARLVEMQVVMGAVRLAEMQVVMGVARLAEMRVVMDVARFVGAEEIVWLADQDMAPAAY
jgi:hypothetical protein